MSTEEKRNVPEAEIIALAEIRKKSGVENLKIFRDPISPICYSESGDYRAEIMVCPYGTYFLTGESKPEIIDDAFIDSMINSFEENIRGQKIPVDEDHRMENAFGWINNLEKREDGLWARCELTPLGAQKIRDKEYLYPSMAYIDKYVNPADGKAGEKVLISLAVTNYPALKGIKSVVSHFSEKILENKKEEDNMPDEKREVKIEELKDAMEGVKSKYAENEKTMSEYLLKLQSELEAERERVQKQGEEIEKIRKDNFRKEMHTRFEALLPRPGSGNYKIIPANLDKFKEYGEKHLNSQEEINDFFELMEFIPGQTVDLEVYGTSENPSLSKMTEDEISEKAIQKAQADPEWKNRSCREDLYRRYESELKAKN